MPFSAIKFKSIHKCFFICFLINKIKRLETQCLSKCTLKSSSIFRDGAKMSKRKKNYPDPLSVINKYGSDALR